MKTLLAAVVGLCCVAAIYCVECNEGEVACKGMCYPKGCTCCDDNCYLPEGSICCPGQGACPGDNTCCLRDGAYWCCDADSVCCSDLWTCCPKSKGCGKKDCGVDFSYSMPAWARSSRNNRS